MVTTYYSTLLFVTYEARVGAPLIGTATAKDRLAISGVGVVGLTYGVRL